MGERCDFRRTHVRRNKKSVIAAFEKGGWEVNLWYDNRDCEEAIACLATISCNEYRYQFWLAAERNDLFFNSTGDCYAMDTEEPLLELLRIWEGLDMLEKGREPICWRPGMNRPRGPIC